MPSVLLTGITGFIGGHTARKLLPAYDVTALVRPSSLADKKAALPEQIRLVDIDLNDGPKLAAFLRENRFDHILHIGALRGGRTSDHEKYRQTNILATELLIEGAKRHGSRFVYCSSVGVFGAIPVQCPANDQTPRREDNFYHVTKIRCEEMVRAAARAGSLDGFILRPAITYGPGDLGFPFTLTKLVDKGLLFFPKKPFSIHMTHIDTISDAFVQSLSYQGPPGKAWIVADAKPAVFSELADFISQTLHCRDYPRSRRVASFWFGLGKRAAKLIRNELWLSRFELISDNWFYDVSDTYRDFRLKPASAIPDMKNVIEWYQSLKSGK